MRLTVERLDLVATGVSGAVPYVQVRLRLVGSEPLVENATMEFRISPRMAQSFTIASSLSLRQIDTILRGLGQIPEPMAEE